MIQLAICDDDKQFLETVGSLVRGYFQRLNKEVAVHLFSDPSELWERFRSDPFNIVILDIIMPGESGIELAKRLFQHNRNCIIAFLTSSPDYAVQGYGVNAIGYLLKPPEREQLEDLLGRCLKRHDESRSRSILFKIGGITRKIDVADVLYLESRNKQVHIHCRDEILVLSGKLSELIPLLPCNFVQIHKSYIVNLDHIVSMTRGEMQIDNGVRISISRQYHKDVSQRYLSHVASEV